MTELVHNSGTIQCTAGAIPVKNEKGEMYMQKVKVQRYMIGKRPEFADESDSDEDLDPTEKQDCFSNLTYQINSFDSKTNGKGPEPVATEEKQPTAEELNDPRFRRLLQLKTTQDSSDESDEEDRVMKHKRYRYLDESDGQSDGHGSDNENNLDVDDAELARRRESIRVKVLNSRLRKEEEAAALAGDFGEKFSSVVNMERNKIETEEVEELGYSEEEYTSSEDEVAPKLKPVFVRKHDRITLQAKQKADQIAREAEEETKRLADERRRDTLKLLESEIRREAEEARQIEDELDALDSDDGHGDVSKEQEEYERWKVRELKRIRSCREAREKIQQEKEEIERMRSLTDDQRREELRKNPKEVTNKALKGKYKFLQKYFHRGAFYVSSENDKVYQQDFAAPTLEDHFDKTKLPAVMQVKNFGRAGQTKYTHLVDQDTTVFDAAWTASNPQSLKFQMSHGGGFKPIFEKPTARKKK